MSEILSPVGGPESLIAAVRSGADAVYLGAGDFNARRNAVGFSEAELGDAAKYCRERGVKLYAALNTLVFDGELSKALEIARRAANLGVDAFIVQDLGLAALLKAALPDVPLHASTQMSVHSKKALKILKELGFCRVVAAREMSKNELADLCSAANDLGVEVEVFVHGALCMSLSGQCYLSGTFGDRSGNRGLCAGPCRLPFSVAGGTGYDLSLKDLCLLSHIEELKKMGVASLKIEGRMKRPEYVAAATAAYRLAADGEKIPDELVLMLKNVFSRNGFTDGYFTEKLGRAMFGRRDEGDKELTAGVLNRLHGLYRTERQSVAVFASLTVKNGVPAVFTLSDGENTACVTGDIPQKAERAPITRDFAFSKLSKLGNSCYKLEKFDLSADDGLMLPSSALGKMRNAAAEKLSALRAVKSPPKERAATPEEIADRLCEKAVRHQRSAPELCGDGSAEKNGAEKIGVEKCSAPNSGAENGKTEGGGTENNTVCGEKSRAHSQVPILARFRAPRFIPENVIADGVILPVESDFEGYSGGKPLFVELPRGMSGTEDYIASRVETAKKLGVRAAFCGNLSSIELCRTAGLPFVADLGMNIANRLSASVAAFSGAEGSVLSFELSAQRIRAVTEGKNSKMPPLGAVIYGRPPLMLLKNCPNKNGFGCKNCGGISKITDRKGETFTLMCRNGFTEMFNPRPLYVADRITEFGSLDFAVAYFTTETADEAEKILKSINNACPPTGEYTRGQYYRTVR